MIAILYYIFIGLFPCRHKWEKEEKVQVNDEAIEQHLPLVTRKFSYLRIICRCSKCGVYRHFDIH